MSDNYLIEFKVTELKNSDYIQDHGKPKILVNRFFCELDDLYELLNDYNFIQKFGSLGVISQDLWRDLQNVK